MQHLDPERLAAFDHDMPSEGERAHLASCARCRQERAAYTRLAELAILEAEAEADPAVAPLTNWDSLSVALRESGLLANSPTAMAEVASGTVVGLVAPAVDVSSRGPAATSGGMVRRLRWQTITRAAAAVLLLVGGVAVGRMSVSFAPGVGAEGGVAALPAGNGTDGMGTEFASVSQATAALQRAQRDFQDASLWLAAHDTTVNAQAVYRARLAALDQMMQASRAGLYQAPQDPALNQYYHAAYTAREATLRQLGASLSVDRVMERY